MKVNSSQYKGIQYVQVSALPSDQREKLLQTVSRDLFIKILVDGKLVGNCLQFRDYEIWFDNVFVSDTPLKGARQVMEQSDAEFQVEALKKS